MRPAGLIRMSKFHLPAGLATHDTRSSIPFPAGKPPRSRSAASPRTASRSSSARSRSRSPRKPANNARPCWPASSKRSLGSMPRCGRRTALPRRPGRGRGSCPRLRPNPRSRPVQGVPGAIRRLIRQCRRAAGPAADGSGTSRSARTAAGRESGSASVHCRRPPPAVLF